MAKLIISRIPKETEFKRSPNGTLFVPGGDYFNGQSVHARSTAYKTCPICSYKQFVYIWSFAGGGKTCESCGALLGYSGAMIQPDKLTKRNYKEFLDANFKITDIQPNEKDNNSTSIYNGSGYGPDNG